MDDLKKVITALCDAVCAIDGLANKEGVFSLFKYVQDFSALGTVNADGLKAQVLALTPEGRHELEALAKEKIKLHNPALEAKLESGIDVLDNLIDVGVHAFSVTKEAILVWDKVKMLLS